MGDQTPRKTCMTAADASGLPCFDLAQARRSRAARPLSIRARGVISTRVRVRACVISTDEVIPQAPALGPSIVTYITPDHSVWSHTAGVRRWTIEMTQSVFFWGNALVAPGRKARTEQKIKTVEQRMGNALSHGEIKRSENGH